MTDAPPQSKTAFRYGWCLTDHKEGREIRRECRMRDYMNDEPYAGRVRAMLAMLGLPEPRPEDIFRGTQHDLLFLNSHGVVLRIGPHDVEDMINPAILQPLGWLEDRSCMDKASGLPLTVAIYPGIELSRTYWRDAARPRSPDSVDFFLRHTGQTSGDDSRENNGFIRVLDDSGQPVAIEMLLDMENARNFALPALEARRDRIMRDAEKELENKADVIAHTLRATFQDAQNAGLRHRAFETHQPLRRLFWSAFRDTAAPDTAKRDAFWKMCARVTNNPGSAILPCWKAQRDADGKTTFIREETFIPHMILYRQWTKDPADNVIPPITQPRRVKVTVKKAQDAALKTKTFKQPPPRT